MLDLRLGQEGCLAADQVRPAKGFYEAGVYSPG